MYNVAGEVAKTTLENLQQATKEVGKKSAFDIPGEASNFGARDFGKGEAGKPGSSFDGPWDKKNEASEDVRRHPIEVGDPGGKKRTQSESMRMDNFIEKGQPEDQNSAIESNKDDISSGMEQRDTKTISRDMRTPQDVMESSPYSKETTDYIRSKEELDLYKNLRLDEGEVNGRKTLKNRDIDPKMIDERGQTNLDRMKNGRSPIGNDGRPIELHHIGQKENSPLAELPCSHHRNNKAILHDTEQSEVDHGVEWQKAKANHWKDRVNDFIAV